MSAGNIRRKSRKNLALKKAQRPASGKSKQTKLMESTARAKAVASKMKRRTAQNRANSAGAQMQSALAKNKVSKAKRLGYDTANMSRSDTRLMTDIENRKASGMSPYQKEQVAKKKEQAAKNRKLAGSRKSRMTSPVAKSPAMPKSGGRGFGAEYALQGTSGSRAADAQKKVAASRAKTQADIKKVSKSMSSKTTKPKVSNKAVKTTKQGYSTYKKGSDKAKSFRKAYASAKMGSTFTWNGKKYKKA